MQNHFENETGVMARAIQSRVEQGIEQEFEKMKGKSFDKNGIIIHKSRINTEITTKYLLLR